MPIDKHLVIWHIVAEGVSPTKGMKKGFFYLLHIIILSAFLCTNVIQADLLAPSTNLPVLYSDAQVDYIALDVISTLSSGDMGRIKVFYEEEIEARIRNGGRNLRCFGIRDMDNREGRWTFYVVDLDKNEVTRYLSADGVRDRFFHVLETIEPVGLHDEGTYKDLKKQKFIITLSHRRFIDTCLDTIYTYPKDDKRWAVDTIEDIFSKINYMGDKTLFSLLLAQTNITPGRFQKVKDEDRWDEILGYIADSSFLDRWYLERLYADGKIDVDWEDLQRLISVVSEIRRGNQEQKLRDSGWLSKEAPELVGKNLVYISPEAKVLGGLKPLLSGGLGVLAGELLVGFGDIGVNTHGVSLLFKKALVQEIDSNGNQIMHEVPVDYSVLPIRDTGIVIDAAVGDRLVKAKVWELREGRARVFLLDTDVKGNRPADKRITEVLYGGNRESPGLRMKQNIVLGRGAILAFEKMGIPIGFLHLNEAHTVISAYDLQKKRDNPLFRDTKVVFTTHTSVEFGLPKFDLRLGGLIDSDSGRVWNYFYKGNSLDFAHAALKMADMVNAVSREHRDVTVTRWAQDWRDSVIGITNGVDVPYWQMPVWNWDNKESAKKKLLEEVERRTGVRLRDDALTIVVSRRITGYKHTAMVLEDLERLSQIIDAQDRPIQIIFAGSSHPGDKFGQGMIKKIVDITRQGRFKGKIVFVPNYNIEFAKLAVRGADIWLNNPEPGEEACATSYAKALKNGTIVISTYTGGPIEHMAGLPLDFDPEDYDVRNFKANGFFIQPYDSDTLYRCIEKARDLYYEYPDVWRKMMLNARKSQVDIRDVAREYVRKAFLVSLLKDRFREEVEIRNMQPAPRQEVEWKVTDDDVPEITVEVKLASIRPEQASVEIYYGGEGARSGWEYLRMKLDKVLDEENGVYLYKGKIPLSELIPGRYGFTPTPKALVWGFTTKVSLMGLRENAFTKWHSWQGNDGVIIIKEATIQELVNKFLSDDVRKFWVSRALYSYMERLLIKNGRIDTEALGELYNSFQAHLETARQWDEVMTPWGVCIKAARCMEDSGELLSRIKSAAANNREFLIYLFKREPRPCRYNYVMAVNKKGELEMSEYNDRYREVYTEAEVIEKLRGLGYIGGDGIIVIQPGDSFSAARTGVIPGASVFLHTHSRGFSTTPSDADKTYWREYSQYWFGRREYADLELAVQSLYKKEIKWVMEHAKRVARLAEIIAGRMGLGDELVRAICIAALAHDLGKGCSRKMIEAANSSGPKREILDRHREEGLRMLEKAGIVLDDVVRQAVLYHHDPWLAAGEYARLATEIVYLADEIDASQDVNRPYKKEAIAIGLLQEEIRRHYETRRISKPVYEAACELLTEHQPAFLDVIYEARGEGLSGEEIDRSHPAIKRGTETAMDLYRVTFDQRGEAVNLEEINPTEKYSKQHIENVLEEVLRELVSEYGPGILSGLKEILITDREGHIGSQVDNRAVIDIDAFGNKRLVKEILEHEALHEILGLIIPDKDDLAEVVATWYSVRRFVNLGQAEKDEEIKVMRERIGDHKYAEFLEYIKRRDSQDEDDLIGPVIAYLNFKGIDAGDVKQADRNFQEALALLDDLGSAVQNRIKSQVKDIETKMFRVVRTLNGPRIVGRASSRVRRLIGFIVRHEGLDLAEARDISKPRYIVVSEDRKRNRLEDILRERYNIHVVTEIPKDAEFVVLVNPEDVGKWKGQELLYLPLPYMEQSLKLAAGMLLSEHEIAKDYLKGFYNILLGRKLSDEEVSNLFHKPWWILPEISALTPDLIILREAISQLEKFA